jgi:transposase
VHVYVISSANKCCYSLSIHYIVVIKDTDARTLSPQTQYELRKQVIRLRKKGMANKDVAEAVGTAPSHASAIWQSYQSGGIEAIKPRVRGRRYGAQRRLTAEQEEAVQKLLVDKTPDQLKLPFALWTRDAVRLAILQRYRINLPIRTMGDYLKRGVLRPRSRLSGPTNKTRKNWPNGLKPIIPRLRPMQSRKRPKSTGGTRPAFGTTPTTLRDFPPRGKRRLSI